MYELLKDDFDWFINNHDLLLEKYPNSFLVIKEKAVQASSNSFDTALHKATELGFEQGTFIIQECTEGNSAYTRNFINQQDIFA